VRAGEQTYPARPVRFILPFAAAGVADITARVAAEKLGDKLGQRFVVENQPGPGGYRGGARGAVANRPTAILSASSPTAPRSAPPSIRPCRSNPVKDFATISTIGAFDLVFATNVESQFKTFDDFNQRVAGAAR